MKDLHKKSDVPYENSYVMKQSHHQHEQDLKQHQVFHPFKKPLDTRSEKSKAFAERWLGHS